MPDKDNNFGGSLGLDFRKWWRHVQTKNRSEIWDSFKRELFWLKLVGNTTSVHLLILHLKTAYRLPPP